MVRVSLLTAPCVFRFPAFLSCFYRNAKAFSLFFAQLLDSCTDFV